MKKWLYYFIIFSSFLFLIYLTINSFFCTEKDIETYHQLLNKKPDYLTSLTKQPLFQERKNVQKDIFLNQNNMRLHFRIYSKQSSLQLTEKKDKTRLIEKLKDIKCFAQDKVTYNEDKNTYEQQLRYFTAKEGTYFYPEHKFLTDSINLSFYDIPEKDLPNDLSNYSAHLKGFAKRVSFILTDKTPQLSAYHFRASFDYFDKEIR